MSTPRIRVALVDDYVLVRKGMAMMLAPAADIELVGEAGDGEEVFDLIARSHPDVILMDIRMPRVDGIEATRRVKERHPEIQVVVMTAYADDDRLREALAAGASGYLVKDVEEDALCDAIRDAAGRS